MDCLFCEIIKKNIPSENVYEDEKAIAFLDIHPVTAGHTLVVPKEHAPDFLSASDETLAHLAGVIKNITPGILKAVGADAWNLDVNSGGEAGQVIFHLHFHIIPRTAGDGHRRFASKPELADSVKEIANKIRNCLEF